MEWHVVVFESHRTFIPAMIDFENFELATLAAAVIALNSDFHNIAVITRDAAPLPPDLEARIKERVDRAFRAKALIESVT